MKPRPLAAWNRFWFEPQPTSTLALVRIFFGLLMLLWTAFLGPDLFRMFSRSGVAPETPDFGPGTWGLLELAPSDAALVTLWIAMLIASACLMVGFRTRLAALVVFLGVLSFQRRDPWGFNSGDSLVRIVALYLVLAPAGVALSLDRLRRARDRFWEFPLRAPWALRLIQVQLSVLYFSTVWQKVRGANWNDGTAAAYSMRIEDLERFPVPGVISDSLLISNVLTFSTLIVELSLGILIWNRALRPWVIAAGIGFHLSIDLTLRVGFFSWVIFACYVAFVPHERATQVILAARNRVAGSRLGRRRKEAPDPTAGRELEPVTRTQGPA